jgi:hypothetical protein
MISGTYDAATGVIRLEKTYASHGVRYDGTASVAEGIVGSWSICRGGKIRDSGMFRIWPDIIGMEDLRSLHARRPVAAGESVESGASEAVSVRASNE